LFGDLSWSIVGVPLQGEVARQCEAVIGTVLIQSCSDHFSELSFLYDGRQRCESQENPMQSIQNLTPTTIEGVKRLAKRLKKAGDLNQSKALDLAAIQAGFADYRSANRALNNAPRQDLVQISGHFS
jgi:hypothetical protein